VINVNITYPIPEIKAPTDTNRMLSISFLE
jgi:hypothetical protein